MKTVETNDTVTISFVGTLANGEVFMSVDPTKPMSFTIGQSELPPTVNNGLIGKAVGDKIRIKVSSEEGYGPRQKRLLQTITNKEFRERVNPKPGMIISMTTERDGEQVKVPATVMEVNDDGVVIDYNHPLAGHDLTYEITILDIQKGTNRSSHSNRGRNQPLPAPLPPTYFSL